MKFDFSQLAEQSEQLNAHLDHSFLIQRNPQQLNEASKKLASKTTKSDLNTNKAHYLLAGKGFDADKHAKSLNSINLKREFEPLNVQSDSNIESFLKNEYETILVSTMEEAQKETVERYERSLLQKMEHDWELRKAKINEELKAPNLYSSYSSKRSIQPDSPLLITSSLMSPSKSIRLESNNEEDKKIDDCWEALKFMLGELPKGENKNKKSREHYFVEGAKKFLEFQYFKVIQSQIQSKPKEAMVGGDPSFISSVRALLRMKLARGQISKDLEFVTGYPVWAQIYYCLRCGKRDEIKRLIQEVQASDKRNILGDFSDYFESYCAMDNQLPSQQWNKLINLYKEISKSPRDPYQQAVYAIIGKCELSKSIPEVFTTTQDFMWLKLNMVKEVDPSTVFSAYNYPLSKLQQLLTEYGSAYFSRNGRNPFLYFQVMILSQQFERGIKYLFNIDEFKTQAFNFAMHLYQYKLLSQPGNSQNEDETLDFVPIIINFAKTLEAKDALKYLAMIDNTKSNSGLPEITSERDSAIKSVLLHSHSFDEFYDACKNHLTEEEIIKIFKSAAQDMDAEGRYQESFKLYRLAKDPKNELGVLSNYMAKVLKQKGIETDSLMKEAIEVFAQLNQKSSNYTDRQSQSTFQYLVMLSEFFYFYHNGDFDRAIQSIDLLGLIPSHSDDHLTNKVESFKLLDENVKRNFADILTAYMDCLYKRYLRLRGAFTHPSKEIEIESIRQRARAVVTFAGFLPYKMPQDTKSNLMRTEVFMS